MENRCMGGLHAPQKTSPFPECRLGSMRLQRSDSPLQKIDAVQVIQQQGNGKEVQTKVVSQARDLDFVAPCFDGQ